MLFALLRATSAVVSLAVVLVAIAPAQVVTRVDVDSSGNQATNGSGFTPALSKGGRFVAFTTSADNLVAGDTNLNPDVFVHDRSTGVTEIESVDTSGNPSSSDVLSCAISGDGEFVALVTNATLAAGDTNVWDYDVMVRDRKAGVTTLATLDSNGVQRDCTAASSVSLSNDGRFVAFVSVEKLDVDLEVSGHEMVFLRDVQKLTTVGVSVSDSGVVADDACFGAVVSADVGLVAFGSWAKNLSSDPSTGFGNVFRRDLAKGVTDWCSGNVNGKSADGDSGIHDDEGHCWIAISPNDGRVAFWSYADDLVAGDTNRQGDVFVFGQPLTLIADPESAPAGTTMTFSSFVGEVGGTLMLVATNVDGIPMFTQVALGLFDSSGLFTLSGVVPFGLNGHVVTLKAFGVLPSGKIGVSNAEVVTFQ